MRPGRANRPFQPPSSKNVWLVVFGLLTRTLAQDEVVAHGEEHEGPRLVTGLGDNLEVAKCGVLGVAGTQTLSAPTYHVLSGRPSSTPGGWGQQWGQLPVR